MDLHISGIDYESITDGEGCRCTIFISGCLHNCIGCQNIKTHNFYYGKVVDDNLIDEINYELKKRPYLSGITISGGDCMYSSIETLELINKLYIPKNNIWLYTGFSFNEIIVNSNMFNLLKKCNVLVDGRFEVNKRDVTLKFRGSSNQRIIDVKESIKKGEVVLWNNAL